MCGIIGHVKKLINSPDTVVEDALAGFALAYPQYVTVHGLDGSGPVFIQRAGGVIPGKVGVVSGGGSGHEPLHGGFIGRGMLDAAAPGAMFTSPTPDQVLAAIQAADGGAGVLVIIKNYTGDVMNFEIGMELAQDLGIEVTSVLVVDDVAVENSTYTIGRRGVAGTVLVERIAGAAAARGDNLAQVTDIAQQVCDQVRSMGVALSACTVPHIGRPSFDLAEDEIELGIGMHGEPGRRRAPMAPAHDLTRQLLVPILEDLGWGQASARDYASQAGLGAGTEGRCAMLLVNGMGASSLSELYIVYASARGILAEYDVTVARSLVGNYVTSLDMQGVSITLLACDDQMQALWDSPVDTVALSWGRCDPSAGRTSGDDLV